MEVPVRVSVEVPDKVTSVNSSEVVVVPNRKGLPQGFHITAQVRASPSPLSSRADKGRIE